MWGPRERWEQKWCVAPARLIACVSPFSALLYPGEGTWDVRDLLSSVRGP